MGNRPLATVRVLPLDHMVEGAFRIEVDCPDSTTGCTQVPGSNGVDLRMSPPAIGRAGR